MLIWIQVEQKLNRIRRPKCIEDEMLDSRMWKSKLCLDHEPSLYAAYLYSLQINSDNVNL